MGRAGPPGLTPPGRGRALRRHQAAAPGPTGPPRRRPWVLEETVRHEARGAVDRAKTGRRRPPAPPARDPVGSAGTGRRRPAPERRWPGSPVPTAPPKLEARLKEAAKAFERGRYPDARRMLRPLVNEAPGIASARELLGLTHYRLGQWNAAIKELEAFRSLTGSTEQHPVLADCYRAQKRWARVDELWEDLRAASPSADLVAEGRIVVAGSLADRGRSPTRSPPSSRP